MRIGAFLLALAGSAMAGEYAVLTSGARLHADRHEADGQMVRLFTKDGITELPAFVISSFEIEEYVPPAPASARPAASASELDLQDLVTAAANKYGLPPEFVHSVVVAESGYQPDAVSPKGAIGLMQLMPATAKEYGVDPTDPAQNVDAGTKHLRDLLLKYDGTVNYALAAYNAGPGAVEKYRGVPPYRETVQYVTRVVKRFKELKK
jgi:soluble lytic murein transglycosylase-like protein